jgi:hypothetical protein
METGGFDVTGVLLSHKAEVLSYCSVQEIVVCVNLNVISSYRRTLRRQNWARHMNFALLGKVRVA